MSTPEPNEDTSRQIREAKLAERERCVRIVAAEMLGQDEKVAALLTRIINLILREE